MCPSAHCYNGDKCIPYSGNLNGQVNCPTGNNRGGNNQYQGQSQSQYQGQNQNQNQNQVQVVNLRSGDQNTYQVLNQLGQTLGINNLNSNTGFSISSPKVNNPEDCSKFPGFYFNGVTCVNS